MKRSYCFLILLLTITSAHAQMETYASITIPDSMKVNADVVLRDEYIKFTLKDISTAYYEVHDVLTVLNENGKNYLNFSEFSYKFRSLDDAEIKVYDVFGVKKNTYSKKEMISLNYGEGLVPEGKLTYFNVSAPSYPFTVEINYTVKYKGTFSYPGYTIQPPGQSVQHSVFEVEVPADLGMRYKLLNTDLQPLQTKNGLNNIYRWEVKNLIAYRLERRSGSAFAYEPAVFIGPNKFQLDDYDGDMTSWKNFGNWISKLYLKTSELSNERKLFYNSLVKNVHTDKEKAEILYRYLQDNMRYVSIQLGIGGLRPFPASFVDEKKYGDCKGLSNYLKSALAAVGVKSNIVIIQGGMTPVGIPEDFPANYFNHAILCIPQPKDTIWLECTSNTLPFAQLGPFTENRKAMMVTDDGGVIVNTPKSNYLKNSTSYTTNIEIGDNNIAKVTTVYRATGEDRDDLLNGFHDKKDDGKRKYFINQNEWKQPSFIDITTSEKSSDPYLVNASMEYEKVYSFKSGNKYFLAPRLHPIFDEEIPETKTRARDYFFTYPYQTFDTTFYKFPAGYSLETLPKNKSITHPFAYYSCNYSWDVATNTLTSTTTLQVKERIVKAADYSKLVEFKKQVTGDGNEKIVMIKE